MSDLTVRLEHIEQVAAIRRLKHSVYCDGIDRLVAGDTSARAALSAHLSADVVADWTGRELMTGKATVEAIFFEQVPATLSFSQHRVLNEVIDIDGDVATASWYLDCPAVFRPGNVRKIEGSALLLGRYQEELVRDNGVWKWRRITALLDVMQTLGHDWQAVGRRAGNR